MTTHDGGVPEATTTGGAFVARIGAENNGHTRGGAPDPPGPPTIDDEHDSEQGHAPEQHHGQLRFAERFCGQHGDSFLHAHGVGWHEFDGTRWAPCLDGAETRAMLATIKKALAELPHLDKRDRDQLYGDISKVESRTGLVGALALAGDLHPCAIAAAALDRDPYLLNTASGTVDLRTGLPRVADPADHLSKVTVGRFDPDARSNLFDDFLGSTQPDPKMRAFLARSLGSALLGKVREHVLLIWHGTGANGKGTLRDAARHAVGDYAVEMPADILLQSKYGPQAMAPERMRLKGVRLAFCSEVDRGAHLDEATMKKLTGGDPINACLKYKNPVEFDPSHTLVMLTNHLPKVRGDDPAVWRRILAVPFDEVVADEDQDGELPEKLKACADAVLAWLWHGWLDYQKQGLNPPEPVTAATRKYQLDSDVLARFLADEDVVFTGRGRVKSAALYQAFLGWATGEGERFDLSNRAFTAAMEARGYKRRATKAGAVWDGVALVCADFEAPNGGHAL